MASDPRGSVVIPAYKRVARVERALGALAHQTQDRDAFEVIVVSDGSTDGTLDYLEHAHLPFNLAFATQENAGPAAARNRGLTLAKGSLVVFVDDDIVAGPRLIEEHVRTHES